MPDLKEIVQDIREGKQKTVFDKQFGDASYDPNADINDIIARSKVVVFGDVSHPSSSLDNAVAEYLKIHKPNVFIAEYGDTTQQPVIDFAYETGQSHKLSFSRQAVDTAFKTRIPVIMADPRTLEEKIALLAEIEKVNQKLASDFNIKARVIFPDHDLEDKLALEQKIFDGHSKTDPAFAEAILKAHAKSGQVFAMVGTTHVEGIRQHLEANTSNAIRGEIAYVDLVPVNKMAYEDLDAFGIFKVNGRYIFPVLDDSGNGYTLNQFVSYLDSMPGNKYDQVQASETVRAYGGKGVETEQYSMEEIRAIPRATFAPK